MCFQALFLWGWGGGGRSLLKALKEKHVLKWRAHQVISGWRMPDVWSRTAHLRLALREAPLSRIFFRYSGDWILSERYWWFFGSSMAVWATLISLDIPHHHVYRWYVLGAFAKLQKPTVIFVMSVCPHGTSRLPLDGFSWNLVFDLFKTWQE